MALYQRDEIVRDFNGVVVSRAFVKVVTGQTYSDTAPLATLYADSAGLIPLINPFQADAAGRYVYWVDAGYYSEQITRPNYLSETSSGFFVGAQQGDPGPTGPTGATGPQGATGATGPAGTPGFDPMPFLADTTNPAKGAALIGYKSSLAYAAGTVGNRLNQMLVVSGMDGTGATDSTSVLAAAIAALPASGGTLYVPEPSSFYAMNLVITKSGVHIKFGGMSTTATTPTGNFLRPFDTALPVVQFGNDSALVTDSSVDNVTLDGNTTGQYGVLFAGGAYRCRMNNAGFARFATRCVAFVAGTTNPCSENSVNGFAVNTAVAGCIGVLFKASATSYCTDNKMIDGPITSNAGDSVVVDGCTTNKLMNTYITQQYSGLGMRFLKTVGSILPSLWVNGVIVDDGGNVNDVAVIIDHGVEYDSTSPFNASPFYGQITNTSKTMNIAGHTTGSVGAGSPTLTVASATGIYGGRGIVVAGAGTAGRPLVAKAISVSGTTVTLDTNAVTGVSGVDVGYGTIFNDMNFIAPGLSNYLTGIGLYIASISKRIGMMLGFSGQIYGSGSGGTTSPWSTSDIIWELNHKGLDFLLDDASANTITGASQATNQLSITLGSASNAGIGDLAFIMGANEPGVNGTWPITTRTDSTHIICTTQTSQTLAGLTGSPVIGIIKIASLNQGFLNLPNLGLRLRNQLGSLAQVLSCSPGNTQTTLQTADPTNGLLNLFGGSAATTANVAQMGGGGVTGFGVSGYGTGRALKGVTGGSYTTTQRNAFTNLASTDVGAMVWDSTLAKPVFLKTTAPTWVDATGATV